MSWNLRTYGSVVKTADELAVIAQTILDSRADIVCIQELMHGHGVGKYIGALISPTSQVSFKNLVDELDERDSDANWTGVFTGRNAGKSPTYSRRKHSADAYGFLWKASPARSDLTHTPPAADPAMTIALSPTPPDNPRILDVAGFPNRRPGQVRLTIDWAAPAVGVIPTLDLSLISFHATTPTNLHKGTVNIASPFRRSKPYKYPAAGTAITRLSWFDDVAPAVPGVNTIILGDFNFDLSCTDNPPNPYASLTGNGFNMGIVNPDIKTTYRPDGSAAVRFVSSYDNIFHRGPALQFVAGQRIDFIEIQSQRVVNPVTLLQSHDLYYGDQHGGGISDHLPVVAEYNVLP